MKGALQPSDRSRPPVRGGRSKDWVIFTLSALLLLVIFATACWHFHEPLPEPEKTSQVFDADEKVVLKAITRVLKDRGFGASKFEADKGRLETDYVAEEDWRTKVVANLQKISRNQTEVTLSVITEKKSSSGWKLKRLMGKEQYDKIFREIEMQIYREWYKGE